jgi:hypothetical protein
MASRMRRRLPDQSRGIWLRMPAPMVMGSMWTPCLRGDCAARLD